MPVSAITPQAISSLRAVRRFFKSVDRHLCCNLARGSALWLIFLLLPHPLAAAKNDANLSDAQRTDIIRAFLQERPFANRTMPRGKSGIRIEGDKITPSPAELDQLVSQYGPVVKSGEHIRITAVRFEHNGIVFEINGGAVKHKSWRDRITVGGNIEGPQVTSTKSTNDDINENFGTFIFLALKGDATSLNAERIKDLLSPFIDFHARTAVEAYEKSLPLPIAHAVKTHQALVGMNRDMVEYAMGRPTQRIRDIADGQPYEEWVYGAPPENVEFIRFVGDKVIRIEDMKVSGERQVRSQNEVGDLGGASGDALSDASAQGQVLPGSMAAPSEQRSAPPSLLRPGEESPAANAGPREHHPTPPPDFKN